MQSSQINSTIESRHVINSNQLNHRITTCYQLKSTQPSNHDM